MTPRHQLARSLDEVSSLFPPDVLTDPLAPFAETIRGDGIPFQELPDSGSDVRIPVRRD